jgi:hypothetical protein
VSKLIQDDDDNKLVWPAWVVGALFITPLFCFSLMPRDNAQTGISHHSTPLAIQITAVHIQFAQAFHLCCAALMLQYF